MIRLPRRSFLLGLGAMITAPAIVHAHNIMPVRSFKMYGPCLKVVGAGGVVEYLTVMDLLTVEKILRAHVVNVQ